MKMRLTKRSVESVPVGPAPIVLWDTELPGFGLKITPTGRRVYFVYYRTSSGTQRRPTIGRHGKLTAHEARQLARKWLAQAIAGEDVSAARQHARSGPRVRDLASKYLLDYAARHKRPASVDADRRNIENHLLPILGEKLVTEMSRADIEALKLAVCDGATARCLKGRPRGRRIVRGGPVVANRVVALASKMFACAEAWGMREGNPARGITKFREHRRDRFLSAPEIQRLLAALDEAEEKQAESLYAIAGIRLLIFTGCRRSEITNLSWRDVDLDRQLLRLADSKTGRRSIALNSPACAVLSSLAQTVSEDNLVLVSGMPGRPIALTRPWHRVRASAGIDASATLHTLRHTFASWSVMSGLSLAQTGAMLGHKSAQTTLRYADHLQQAVRQYSEQTAQTILDQARAAVQPEQQVTAAAT